MSSFIGKGATVNKPDALTHGKPCVIVEYVRETRKYRVEFDNSWTGWYLLKELTVDNALD